MSAKPSYIIKNLTNKICTLTTEENLKLLKRVQSAFCNFQANAF